MATQLVDRPQVRARRKLVRRELVLQAVAREERDTTIRHRSDHDRCRRVTVRRRQGVLFGVVEE
jgi:hypothetical protein